jgi:hypothetical protein
MNYEEGSKRNYSGVAGKNLRKKFLVNVLDFSVDNLVSKSH